MATAMEKVTEHPNAQEVTAVAPSRGWASLGLRELWTYRELLYFLTWRDIKVRYKQTVLGASWAIIQPVFTMIVFSLFFGRLANVPSDGIPYPLFSLCALVPWTYFAQSVTQASGSLVAGANLIQKVYFPRLAVPTGAVIAGLVDLGIAFLVLVGLMIYYGVDPSLEMLLLPVFVLIAIITALGVGCFLAALNVRFRDVRYALPFLIQLWLFATPVAYPSSLVPNTWRTIYGINPMVGVVEGFRWALLDAKPPGPMLLVSSAVAFLLLVGGVLYFRRMERTFADIV